MHHSILLASALAAGTWASPHLHKRATYTRIATETQFATVTVIVTVTAGDLGATIGPLPGSSSATITSSDGEVSPLPSLSLLPPPSQTTVPPVVNPSDTNAPIGGSPASSIPLESSSGIVLPNESSSVVVPDSSSVAPSASASPAPPTVGPAHISGPSQASLSVDSGNEYRNAILFHHNQARANHGAGELVWNDDCERNARGAAETCEFAHTVPTGANQGQNLFTVSGNYFNVTAGITESWYKSEFPAMQGHFGEASLDDDTFHAVGHLTQVLWKATTGVGCYSLDCQETMVVNGVSGSRLNKYTVCNYFPQGNIATLYAENVGFPISETDLGSWTD